MTQLRRELGLADTTAVVIGAIIGVGIFFTPSEVARIAGSPGRALGLWALGGLCALLGAFTFAALGRRYPTAGGQYVVLRDAWGPLYGYLYVFCNLTAIQTGTIGIIGVICADNLARAAGIAPSPTATLLGALALIVGVSAANMLGVRQGARLQNVTVLGKLLTLAAVVGVATVAPATPVSASPPPPSAALLAGLLPAMFAYGGWQQALWIGGEVKDGERTLPVAIVAGVGVVVVAYLAAAWAYFALLGFDGVVQSRALAADAIGVVAPGLGARLAALAVGVSAFGVLNADLLTGPRLVWALSRDGRFPRAFGHVHATWGTPAAAIALLGGLSAALLVGAGPDGIDRLTAWVVVVDALFFALTGLALVRLEGRVRAASVVPIGFALIELGAVYGALLDPHVRGAALLGFGWIAAATLTYRVRGLGARR